MARPKVPVSINGLEFDALMSESRSLSASVPEYSVEEGYVVSDSIILGTETLQMTLFVTNTPVTWYERHGSSRTRVKDVEKRLEQIFLNSEPVRVITNDAVYTSMAIESISFSKSLEQGYAREIPISFKKIRITKSRTTTIPSYYGKSGGTGTSAGSANTTTGSSGSGKGSDSDSNKDGKSKSSILYNVASSIGIVK